MITERWVVAEVARALGRPLASSAEFRIARLLFMVVMQGGQAAEEHLTGSADSFARLISEGKAGKAPVPGPPRPGG